MKTSAMQAMLGLQGFENISQMQFKRGPMRKAFRDSGRMVAKASRKKISKRGGSNEHPGRRTGRMAKSIKVRLGSGGFYAKVQHQMPAPASKWEKDPRGEGFYPAFLHYGTKRGLRSRGNWIADALAEQEGAIMQRLRASLNEALK
ncbi:hypothetical protein [Alcaligenes faecalis]|uniref:hypothetical protein n=1 Tax=Alcaligenes aquatilis TaxID=323284 RepID=UPI002AA752C7|nr:hypothetical protein [Alcaligenes faecalis]